MFGSRAREKVAYKTELRLGGIFSRLERLETAPTPEPQPTPTDPAITEHLQALEGAADSARLDIADLDRKLKELTFAVEEGIERVGRAERRIHATIARARKELKDRDLEDPGVEAEAAQLRVVDGGGGPQDPLSTVPGNLGEPPEEASSIRGVSAAALQRVRGT